MERRTHSERQNGIEADIYNIHIKINNVYTIDSIHPICKPMGGHRDSRSRWCTPRLSLWPWTTNPSATESPRLPSPRRIFPGAERYGWMNLRNTREPQTNDTCTLVRTAVKQNRATEPLELKSEAEEKNMLAFFSFFFFTSCTNSGVCTGYVFCGVSIYTLLWYIHMYVYIYMYCFS